MNIANSIPDDNVNINVKSYILDPLSVIIKLAILSNKPVGTKILIRDNVIYLQEPGPFQSFCRIIYNTNKTDLQYIFNPLNIACLQFLSKTFVDKTPRIKKLFTCALNGIKKLKETYKNCSIIVITLNYYYALLTNHIQQVYNENMFINDGFTCYYTQHICDTLNKQWSEAKIKVVLDLISFLLDNDDSTNNVKSLENIINGIDLNTKNIISTL